MLVYQPTSHVHAAMVEKDLGYPPYSVVRTSHSTKQHRETSTRRPENNLQENKLLLTEYKCIHKNKDSTYKSMYSSLLHKKVKKAGTSTVHKDCTATIIISSTVQYSAVQSCKCCMFSSMPYCFLFCVP